MAPGVSPLKRAATSPSASRCPRARPASPAPSGRPAPPPPRPGRSSARCPRSAPAGTGPAGSAAGPAPGRTPAAARSPPPSTPAAGPRSASASTRVASSSRSGLISGVPSSASLRRAAAMAFARRCRATRSRGPIRQRAPVSSRSSAAPSVGSASTRSVHTTSRTSGVSSRPPRPTTSTGRPRSRSADSIAGIWLRSRTSTAVVGRSGTGMCSGSTPGIPAAPRQACSTLSAIQSASSAYVRSRAQCTVPPAAPRALRCGPAPDAHRRAQLRHPGAGGPQRGGQRVGDPEDLGRGCASSW